MQLDAKALKAAQDVFNDSDNSTTFRVLSEAIRAYLIAVAAAPPQVEPAEDVAELVGELTSCATYFEKFYGRTKTVETIVKAVAALTNQSAELLSLRRKVEEQRKALEPFGRENDIDPSLPDDTWLSVKYEDVFVAHATAGDFRRARALAGDKP